MSNNNLDYLEKYFDKDKLEEGKLLLDKGISPQYIVGNVDFYGNIINVDDRVLIPRFETELLVEKTVSYINKLFDSGYEEQIIDIVQEFENDNTREVSYILLSPTMIQDSGEQIILSPSVY